MLKDITMKAMQSEVKELLSYSVFPDPEAVDQAAPLMRRAQAGCLI